MMKKKFVLIPDSARFYTNDKPKCLDNLRFTKDKYPKKVLIYIVISNCAMSKPYLHISNSVAVNTTIYINEILQPKLLFFIYRHHDDFNYLFEPYLSGAYYSNETVA